MIRKHFENNAGGYFALRSGDYENVPKLQMKKISEMLALSVAIKSKRKELT